MPKYRYTTAQLQAMSDNPWLTDREKRAFDLYHRRGWAIEDVAAEMDVSRRTVDNILKSIRDKTL